MRRSATKPKLEACSKATTKRTMAAEQSENGSAQYNARLMLCVVANAPKAPSLRLLLLLVVGHLSPKPKVLSIGTFIIAEINGLVLRL